MSINKFSTPAPIAPVFINLPSDQGIHAAPVVDIWYVSCSLAAGERQFHSQVVVVTNYAGPVSTHVYLVEAGSPSRRHEVSGHTDLTGISAGVLDIRLPKVSLSGTTDGFTLHAALGEDTMDLALAPRFPILYANGTGMFPYHGDATYQYSMAGMDVSGTLTIDGEQIKVEGQGWHDRQWASSAETFGSKDGFIWMGLCLENGDNISLWDIVAPDGKPYCWATVVKPDSTHVISPVVLSVATGGTAGRGPWIVNIPGIETELVVAQQAIHDEASFYSGSCKVSGNARSGSVTGYGFVDVVLR